MVGSGKRVDTSTSKRSSRTSIVSIDPAIAMQITGSATTKGVPQSGHVRTESTPARATSKPLAAMSRGHARTNSAPGRDIKKRSNSLRRAKNSTELLKQRSDRAEKNGRNPQQPGSPQSKRGRNFTVSNVGTGGLLHLSPSPRQQPFSTNVASPSPYPWLPPTAPPVLSDAEETTLPSQLFHARTRSVSPRGLLDRAAQTKTSKDVEPAHNRSASFSTIDEARRSIAATLEPKTFRIVINRPDSVHSSDEEELVPTLEIPIPHYKLGTPRFSAHGTPFIRGSSYTYASGNTSTQHSSMTDGYAGPPLASVKAPSRLRNVEQSEESVMPMPSPLHVIKSNEQARSASVTSYVSPITADLYDSLLEAYDDPSVVRYTSERDVAAATKIRIIAQISSESFMDYDLVSDFFLTFRSYMTTFEVLDYLLARLRWSIGRLSDDGRIIRIRTFAALRHWILNYFDDDFVINRHLRVRFCDEVNDMYNGVRQRPRGVGGVSDLKILQDLKRCWNGRCALYWDAEEFNMDSDQEEPLLPGGVLGSRNPVFADISEATAALGLGLQEVSAPSPRPSSSFRAARRTQHKRLPSSDYAKKPMSVGSVQSLQATSCSLPRRRSPTSDEDTEVNNQAPQPVSMLSRRRNAPSDLKVHVHPLSDDIGDSMNSSRGQTPVEVLMNSGNYSDPRAGSMIRGFVYGPVEPFIQMPMNPPLSPALRFSVDQQSHRSPRVPASPQPHCPSPQNPAVKNIFGSIRRALSGKQGPNEVTMITVSSPRPSTSQTPRRAPVPLNLAHSNDDLRRKAAGLPVKTQMRIDLLCAAAVQSFQQIVPGTPLTVAAIQEQSKTIQQAPFSPPLSSPDDLRNQFPHPRLASHYTDRSGSILIVDDTAVAMPVMSGALPGSFHHQTTYTPTSTYRLGSTSSSNAQHSSFVTQIAIKEDEDGEMVQPTLPQEQIGLAQSTGLDLPRRDADQHSITPSAVTVLKLESASSLQEGRRSDPDGAESLSSRSPPPMTEATSSSGSPVSKAPAHGLRRRPGGDLRNNQNVQDLEPDPHHDSMDSMIQSSSQPESMLIMSKPVTAEGPENQVKKSKRVSMINTHSSQHLRPSFEAAVAGFSAIPDEDDGGLEATLMKLEGKYESPSPDLSNPSLSSASRSSDGPILNPLNASPDPQDNEAVAYREDNHAEDESLANKSFLHDENVNPNERPAQSQPFAHRSKVFGLPTESLAGSDSEESDISLPILKRNTTIEEPLATNGAGHDQGFVGQDGEARSSSDILESKGLSIYDEARPATAHTEGGISFLLDDDENMSDLSSEISVDIMATAMGKPVSPMLAAPGTAISGLEIPSHPLTHASLVNLPVTTPALAGSPFTSEPPTPQESPLLIQKPSGEALAIPTAKKGALIGGTQVLGGPAHVPFILACDSQVLAQQMTIVEQSALTEIEWSDLVELRWNNDKSNNTLDWAEYMAKHDDARGIDVVTARFNLVHKWVQSEIVLTQDIEERARVLSKFIHVAAHARRLHNYATMLQITLALMSTSCTRLRKTWELVAAPDRSLLKHMEDIAQPRRNFHDLRVEMESTDLSSGCIPFLALYVHDLNWNAQKPAQIRVQNEDGDEERAEPLINFERFRTAAVIIKGLLRLIDASLRYDFEPIHGIIERCLWMSALTDERIDALSKALEL